MDKSSVFFETNRHSLRRYPPQQQLKESGGASLISYLPFRGITHLRDKWSKCRHPRRLGRLASLFVSVRGYYVAVASGNQITILQKDNEYKEPVGTFTCGSTATFTCGTWSESHELLGVVDDTDTIYIVKPNGDELTRITKKHLHASSFIAGLIVHDASEKNSYLCTFTVFVSDGSFHNIEISKDTRASIFSTQSLNNSSMPRQFPLEICCWDYHPSLSLLGIVSCDRDIQPSSNGSSTGSCSITIWRNPNLEMERVASIKFEGSYSLPKEYHCQLSYPKVIFSPLGHHVASLDWEGSLVVFQFDEKTCSFSKLFYGKSSEFLHDILDFTWWSDCVLTLAKRNGTITMFDILSHAIVSENDRVYSTPLLERAQQLPGLVFLLENSDCHRSSEQTKLVDLVMREGPDQLDFSKMEWSLVSLVKRSVLEVYDDLISSQRYEDALDFAARHELDKDEVLKSQWLSCDQGVREIDAVLSIIKDQFFLMSECVDKVGPTEDAVRSLISFGLRLTDSSRFSESEDTTENEQIWIFRLARLKLLKFRDSLETFLGVNMGRFSVQEYGRFRELPISKAALALAESGKIGALNLVFKRHPYSTIPWMFEILAAIPETIPVQSYGDMLPGISSPTSIVVRDDDWVECEKTVMFLNNLNEEGRTQYITEPIMKLHTEFQWPSISQLSSWYKKRARDIDSSSGQLDNSMSLVDLAIRKGVPELQQYLEDIFYLHLLIYSDENEDFSTGLATWEQLPDYEKFKLMMVAVKDDNMITRLNQYAIPFMERRFYAATDASLTTTIDSFLVRWMKEIAAQNKLGVCSIIIEQGYTDMANNGFFKDDVELADCALQCMYFCTDVDSWSTMSTILFIIPPVGDLEADHIKNRLKLAEGHVEAGRLLAYYQVPKPMRFFLEAASDEKGVKQILRLLLSKFIRLQQGQTYHDDWENLWSDLESLQEKAFPFLDLEYMLIEFCRGLLRAENFSLAKKYLKDAAATSSLSLAKDKTENLVIQVAREYFFAAPTLACSKIGKAKECLNIFHSSRNVRKEVGIIDAVTYRLPNMGVNLLPMEFKQIKDPMEIIKLAITSASYLNVDEVIEVAKLIGLSSKEEILRVKEAIAREASIVGEFQLAFD